MEYMQLSMDDYIQSKNEIKQELGGIVKSFVRIGWQLTRIDKSGAYKPLRLEIRTEYRGQAPRHDPGILPGKDGNPQYFV